MTGKGEGSRVTKDAATSSQPEIVAAPKRVLVVDDNADNRELLTRRLQRKGFVAVAAEGGVRALELIEQEPFDAVVLDVMMPDLDGLAVLERIREKHSKTELPVIMATARSDSGDVVGALERGANDYVTKPIDLPILVARINVHLGTKQELEQQPAKPGAPVDLTRGLTPGTVIDGRYEVRELLGEGGFANVHRAVQLSTGQEVALKYARPERARSSKFASEVARFMREMKLLARIKHPHIVRLIDSGTLVASKTEPPPPAPPPEPPEQSGASTVIEPAMQQGELSETREKHSTQPTTQPSSSPKTLQSGALPGPVTSLELPYLVMEMLEGELLSSYIKRRAPLEPARAIKLILPVLEGLDTAHREGVIHRDVKPENVILVSRGGEIEPRIVDFGIAKLLEPEAEAITMNESFIGTPAYMAPEQGRGKSDIDGRADQFATAAILYHAVTGQKLYTGSSFFEVLHAVTQAEFKRPRDLRPDLDPEFEAVLLKALSVDREDRFDSVVEFALALVRFASPRTRLKYAHRFEADDDATDAKKVNPLAETVPGNVRLPAKGSVHRRAPSKPGSGQVASGPAASGQAASEEAAGEKAGAGSSARVARDEVSVREASTKRPPPRAVDPEQVETVEMDRPSEEPAALSTPAEARGVGSTGRLVVVVAIIGLLVALATWMGR